MAAYDSFSTGEVEVRLDGLSVEVPSERQSFSAIRSYLESLALQQQRILCSLAVDGEQVNLTQPRKTCTPFVRIDGETMSLAEVPSQLVRAALQQAVTIRSRVHSAVELVLINDGARACEIWWSLATALKEPLLTLSLLPEDVFRAADGSVSIAQLRKWQLQQLGRVIHDVDEACQSGDTTTLSDVLENRVLPWLDNLCESLHLWNETLASRAPNEACHGV